MSIGAGLRSLFDPDAEPRRDSLVGLIVSDYLAYYGPPTPTRVKWSVWGSRKAASPRKLGFLFLPRMLTNPCMHATVLIRLAGQTPRLISLWRTILIAKHSIDVQRHLKIGPGLVLPHPFNIGLGIVEIGDNATLLNGVMVGGNTALGGGLGNASPGDRLCPRIGDDVVIFAGATLVGQIDVGERAVIGAGAWVDHDVPRRSVVPGQAAVYRQLNASRRSPRSNGSESDQAVKPPSTTST